MGFVEKVVEIETQVTFWKSVCSLLLVVQFSLKWLNNILIDQRYLLFNSTWHSYSQFPLTKILDLWAIAYQLLVFHMDNKLGSLFSLKFFNKDVKSAEKYSGSRELKPLGDFVDKKLGIAQVLLFC